MDMNNPKETKNYFTNVTLKEVASALGLSAMTVSRAINNKPNVDAETKKKVLQVAKEMGYTPNLVAKSLVSSRTHTIGVVIPEISHSFFPEVVKGIEEVTNAKNYQIFLTNTSDNFEKEKIIIAALIAKRVDGILVSSSLTTSDASYYKQLADTGLPIVFFDRVVRDVGISCIGVNDKTASEQVTEHLIAIGYKKIGYLGGPKQVSIGKERFEGFIAAMTKHQMEINEKWIIENGYNEKSGYQSMSKILGLPENERPKALVAVNDPVAIGAIQAIREAGFSVPHDFAIVGFSNDIRSELMTPSLTTVHQPAYEVGKKAATKLIQLIEEEENLVENVELNTNLIVRESCGSQNNRKIQMS